MAVAERLRCFKMWISLRNQETEGVFSRGQKWKVELQSDRKVVCGRNYMLFKECRKVAVCRVDRKRELWQECRVVSGRQSCVRKVELCQDGRVVSGRWSSVIKVELFQQCMQSCVRKVELFQEYRVVSGRWSSVIKIELCQKGRVVSGRQSCVRNVELCLEDRVVSER